LSTEGHGEERRARFIDSQSNVERENMKTLIHALVLGTFAAVASAQTATPAPDTKAKQETVKEATEQGYKQSGKSAAEGSAKAAATKGTPKALPDKKAKQQAAKEATEQGYKQSGRAAAEGSAKAAADKTPKAQPPKMSENEEALKKAAKP